MSSPKNKFLIISCIFAIIIGLVVITNWRFKNWQDGFSRESLLKLPDLGGIDDLSSSQETTSQKFISKDGRLVIDYPADWAALEQQEIISAMAPEIWVEKYGLQTLLFALTTDGKSGQLIVYKGNFGGLTAKEIIGEIKQITEERGWKMDIVSSEIKENGAVFEAKYQTSDNFFFHSKEKILTNQNESYIISVIVPEQNWLGAKEDIDKILNSAIIVSEERM